MTRRLILAPVLTVSVAALSVGAAIGWLSDSAVLDYRISAASDFGGDGPEEKVWVCKLAGEPHDPWISPGANPIHVDVDSVDAQEGFSDAHPSYVVENGEVDCRRPTGDMPAPEASEETRPNRTTTTTTTATASPKEETTAPATTTTSAATTSTSTTTSTTGPTSTTTTTPVATDGQ